MQLAKNSHVFEYVKPQTWESQVLIDSDRASIRAVNASNNLNPSQRTARKKQVVKSAIERKLQATFPVSVPIGGITLRFRFDASDAVGIALWGARCQHERLTFGSDIMISSPLI